MTVTIDIGQVLKMFFITMISVGLLIVALNLVFGWFYDHFAGDKSTKEYKERNKKVPNDIADVLKENPDVRIKIVGHTDSDGDNAKNLDLSQRRAKSVMNELVKVFGIDASRIETDGMGETKPVAPNDTPVNKALNRRVEFIKL